MEIKTDKDTFLVVAAKRHNHTTTAVYFISLPSSLFYYIKTIKGRGKHRWKRMLRALPPYSVPRPNFVDVAVEGAVLRAV